MSPIKIQKHFSWNIKNIYLLALNISSGKIKQMFLKWRMLEPWLGWNPKNTILAHVVLQYLLDNNLLNVSAEGSSYLQLFKSSLNSICRMILSRSQPTIKMPIILLLRVNLQLMIMKLCDGTLNNPIMQKWPAWPFVKNCLLRSCILLNLHWITNCF